MLEETKYSIEIIRLDNEENLKIEEKIENWLNDNRYKIIELKDIQIDLKNDIGKVVYIERLNVDKKNKKAFLD